MPVRLAARAVLVHDDRLLLVNAFAPGSDGGGSDLWCAPGGGVEMHASLADTLAREVGEETGLRVEVGPPCLVNEFHDPDSDFHQVEVFFRCRLSAGALDEARRDPEGVVVRRRWFARGEVAAIRLKPDALPRVAWGEGSGAAYDPLERLVR